jgi:hypothetical protein
VLSEPRLIVPGIDGVLPSPHVDTATTERNISVPQQNDASSPPPKELPEGVHDAVLLSGNLDRSKKRPRIDDNDINDEVVTRGPPFGLVEEGKKRTGKKKKKGNKEKHGTKP